MKRWGGGTMSQLAKCYPARSRAWLSDKSDKSEATTLKSNIALATVVTCVLALASLGAPVAPDEASRAAQSFLQEQAASDAQLGDQPQAVRVPRNGQAVYQQPTRSIGAMWLVQDDSGTTVAFVHEVLPMGFIITAADDRVPSVLGYSFEGVWCSNPVDSPLVDLVRWDMTNRLASLDAGASVPSVESTAAPQYAAQANPYAAASSNTYGPWMTSDWTQSGRYNAFCPYVTANTPGERRVVGCVATAIAQVVNYWKYPSRVWFPSSAYPHGCAYQANGISFDSDAVTYGFPTFAQLETALSFMDYNNDDSEVGRLCFAAGIKVRMNYGAKGSGAMMDSVPEAMTTGFSYGSASLSTSWSDAKANVIDNLTSQRPVILGINKSTGWDGHAVIADGYQISPEMFHVNFGWGGTATAWYSLPSSYGAYDTVNSIIFDILPKAGWTQRGGDARNTFSSIFRAPTVSDPPVKWKVSTTFLPDHGFAGMTVGPGGTIFATFKPRILNDTYHPGVSVFDRFGSRVESYYLSETGGITMPAVNSSWQVFVAGSQGGVYRVDTNKKNLVPLFQEPYSDEFYDPKIDRDDRLYVATVNRLYCLSTTGTLLWTYAPGSGRKMWVAVPAIDADRENVYTGSYDAATKQSYLSCINRQTGTLRYERTFANIPYASQMTGMPSIGDDGTVFVKCATILYAFTPGTSSFFQKWSKDTLSMSTDAPAIGPNGALYVSFWRQMSGSWTYIYAAVDAASGTTRWEMSFSMGDYDLGIQPYVASNMVVICRIHRHENNTFEVYAYKDNGSTADLLWQKNYGEESGGDIAFGPGDTLYVLPSGGGTIYALSQGQAGNPYQAAMEFLDNSAPTAPSAASPADGATQQPLTMQLTWNASDPDGHALKYDVSIAAVVAGREAAFVPVARDITTQSCQVQGLQPGTQYLWSVVVSDGQALSIGPTWSFTTACAMPAKVAAPSPANGATNLVDTELNWGTASGATSYDVYFSTSPTPGSAQYLGNTGGTGWDLLGSLPSGAATYYWRVDTKNACGTTTGDVWSFTTAASCTLAAKASSPSPSNGAIGVSTSANLNWANASGASSYDVYFGTDSTPDSGELLDNTASSSWALGTLSENTTYYWRVDTKNACGTTTGDVWSFTTSVAPSCGDGTCNGSETCSSCPGDCGACPPQKGACCMDGDCTLGVTESACEARSGVWQGAGTTSCGNCLPPSGDEIPPFSICGTGLAESAGLSAVALLMAPWWRRRSGATGQAVFRG